MAYDERLADRVRELLRERTDVTERRMFGGLTFMNSLWLTAVQQYIPARALSRVMAYDWLTSLGLLHLSTAEFVKGLKLLYQFKDTWFGLAKSASFGFTIALVGCVVGLGTYGGAEGVGRSTTRAVVASAMLILLLDAFWAVVLL